jgi:hypothetical protein
MPALPVDFDPYNPIPNGPFYSIPSYYLQGPTGPLVIGSGLSVSLQGVISSTGGGGGGGTVTSITAGLGLTGGTITGSGTIGLAPSGVAAGAYTYPALSVDASGRITSIMNGSPVTGVAVSVPLLLSGSPTSPTISIQPASTTQTGSVQLNNTTSSTLTNQALTAAAGKSLQDQINAVAQNANGLILAGTLNAATGNVVNATTAGVSAGFTAGSPVPAASPAINDYYLIVTTAAASYTPTGGSAITGVLVGDYILCSSGAWTILRVGPITGAYATTTAAGVVELATSAEAIAGTNPNVVLTPFTGAATYVNRYCFTGPGQVLASNGNATYAALGAGIDGQVLTADASAPLGVKWAAGGGGGGATINMSFLAPITGTANPYTGGVVAVGINTASTTALGAVQLADTAATQAGVSASLAVTPLGAASTYIPFCDFTAKGQLIVGSGAGTFAIEPPGADGLALVACAACTNGLTYASPLAAATPSTLGAFRGFASGVGGNLSLGGSSLGNIGAGVANTALGTQAAFTLTTGNGNTVVGNGALALDTTGSCNVAVGVCALYSTVGGEGNTALGTGAGAVMTSGDFNVLVGFCAGDVVTTGCYNIAIGANAMGTTSTTGCNNVLIGCTAGGNVTTQSNQIVIGGGNSCTTGNVNGGVTFVFGGGCALYASANGTNTWTAVSDQRLKENVADLALGLRFVEKLQPRTFDWKADGAHAAGFIAQEVAEVVDEHDADYLHLVDRSNEHMGLSATTLIPVLVNAIKELKAEVDELKAKLS